MSHRITEANHRGQWWDPVRAIHSNKVYHLNLLKAEALAATGADALPPPEPLPPVRERGTRQRGGLVFTEAYPDTRTDGGMSPLTARGWQFLRLEFDMPNQLEWVKHLLNFHDGEVRFVGDPWWADVTDAASGGCMPNLRLPAFWHPQTMRTKRAKEWCFWNHGAGQTIQWRKQEPLTPKDIAWIMRVEGGRDTLDEASPCRSLWRVEHPLADPPGEHDHPGGTVLLWGLPLHLLGPLPHIPLLGGLHRPQAQGPVRQRERKLPGQREAEAAHGHWQVWTATVRKQSSYRATGGIQPSLRAGLLPSFAWTLAGMDCHGEKA